MTESSRLAPRSLKTLGNVWKDQILWVELSSGLCITLRKWSLHVRRDSRISEMTDMWDICWKKKWSWVKSAGKRIAEGRLPQPVSVWWRHHQSQTIGTKLQGPVVSLLCFGLGSSLIFPCYAPISLFRNGNVLTVPLYTAVVRLWLIFIGGYSQLRDCLEF